MSPSDSTMASRPSGRPSVRHVLPGRLEQDGVEDGGLVGWVHLEGSEALELVSGVSHRYLVHPLTQVFMRLRVHCLRNQLRVSLRERRRRRPFLFLGSVSASVLYLYLYLCLFVFCSVLGALL